MALSAISEMNHRIPHCISDFIHWCDILIAKTANFFISIYPQTEIHKFLFTKELSAPA